MADIKIKQKKKRKCIAVCTNLDNVFLRIEAAAYDYFCDYFMRFPIHAVL